MSKSRKNPEPESQSFPLQQFFSIFKEASFDYFNTRSLGRLARTSKFFRDLVRGEIATRKKVFIGFGQFFGLLLSAEGDLYLSGKNFSGAANADQRKAFATLTGITQPITQFDGTHNPQLFLLADKTVKAFHCDENKPLGLGTEDVNVGLLTNIKKVISGKNKQLFLDEFGFVWEKRYKANKPPEKITGLSGVKDVLDCDWFTLCVLENGDVQIRLVDSFVKLDISDVIQIACGWNHALFLKRDNTVSAICYGNSVGQVGLGPDRMHTKVKTPKNIPLPPLKQIAAGEFSSYFVTLNGEVYVCGSNFRGQLGLGHTNNQDTPQPILNLPPIEKLVAADDRVLVVAKNGKVYGWGANNFGHLFITDRGDKVLPTPVEITLFDIGKQPEIKERAQQIKPPLQNRKSK